jgi:hypothetical protein
MWPGVRTLFIPLTLAAACRGPDASTIPAHAEAPPGLTLDLAPDPEHGEVAVTVRVSADRAARVRELTVARTWADTRGAEAILAPHARDADGEVRLTPRPDDGGPDVVYTRGRAPRGELSLRYRAAATTGRSRLALRIAEARMSGVGHAFLLLPRIDEPVPARVRIRVERLRRGADAASA